LFYQLSEIVTIRGGKTPLLSSSFFGVFQVENEVIEAVEAVASVKIRKLKNADMFLVIGLLEKAIKVSGSSLKNMFVSATESATSSDAGEAAPATERMAEVGLMVLSELYKTVVDDLQAWFASLLNISTAEYLDLPPDTTLDIIEQLTNGEDSRRFFSRALQLSKTMSGLKGIMSGK
jgi:hypothetical protein